MSLEVEYEVKMYKRGEQYNDNAMYSVAQFRGYNHSLPLGFFNSYSTIGITSSNYYRKRL